MNYHVSGRGNSDQMRRRNDNILSRASGHMMKLFRCSFCERGFSNAQALGGHMNIHRKDRAKLKEFADDNLLSLEITKTGENSPVDPSASEEEKAAANPNDNQDVIPKSIQSVHSLSLFAASGDDDEKGSMKLINGGVDLELRLGHHPHHDVRSINH